MIRRSLLAVALSAGLLGLSSSEASAAEPAPFTLGQPAAEVHLGLGAYTGDGRVNPYGFGLGLRGGTTLPQNIYLGGLAEYYFGASETRSDGFFDTIKTSANIWLLQLEPGYDFAVSEDVVLRPHFNLGFAYANRENCILDVCDQDDDANISMAPSGSLLYRGQGYVLHFTLRYNAVATASDRSSGDAFLITVGIGTALERLGIRWQNTPAKRGQGSQIYPQNADGSAGSGRRKAASDDSLWQ